MWPVTLRADHVAMQWVHRMRRRYWGTKRKDVTGDWRKLRSGERRDLYSSQNNIMAIKSRKDELGRACGTHGEKWKAV
jgi:hypothetical protein